jgi:hypothetical protein
VAYPNTSPQHSLGQVVRENYGRSRHEAPLSPHNFAHVCYT